MGKIVKYCSACEEGFAEKFSFCPNCANELTAFEMKPVVPQTEVQKPPVSEIVDDEPVLEISEPVKAEMIQPEENTPSISNKNEPPVFEYDESNNETVFEPVEFESDEEETEEAMISAFSAEEAFSGETNKLPETEEYLTFEDSGSDSIEETENFEKSETEPEVKVVYDDFGSTVTSQNFSSTPETFGDEEDDGGYHITVIKEKNVKQRNLLLVASAFLMISVTLGGVIYSIFTSPLFVGAIGDERSLVALIPLDEVPIDVEEPERKKDDKDGGGGGGGGKQEKTETSKGVLANQTEKPMFPPTSRAVRLTNPSLMIERSTQGNIKRPPTDEPYGNPNSKTLELSDGKGSGGGMGSGVGTGQGSGRGTGEGSGIGSGSGSGIGDGNGDGRGSGNGTRPASPPPTPRPVPSGPTVGIQILSKPRPGYTDSARTNNVQGTVLLRVTFLANGRIGGVSAVKGLPNGLTEKAIAAARQIQFKPAMRNGQPYSVTKSIQYNFTIY